MANLKDISDDVFEQEVVQADRPVVVDFWAPWCAPCRSLGKTLEGIAEQRGDALKVVKINIDDHPQQAIAHGVMLLPTIVVYKDGKVVDRLQGSVPPRQVEAMIERHVGVAAGA